MDMILYVRVDKNNNVLGASADISASKGDNMVYAVPVSDDKDMESIKELAKQGLTLQEFLKKVNKVKDKTWKKTMVKNRPNQQAKEKDEIQLTEREKQRLSNLYGGY